MDGDNNFVVSVAQVTFYNRIYFSEFIVKTILGVIKQILCSSSQLYN